MGFISVLQGAALQDRYRALVLVQSQAGSLSVSAQTVGGLTGEQFALRPAARTPLDGMLRQRKLTATLFEATNLRPRRQYSFVFSDAGASRAPLDAYTLPSTLPAEGITVAVGSCYYRGFHVAERIGAALRGTWLGGKPLLQFWVGDNVYMDVPTFGIISANKPYEQTLDRYLEYFNADAYMVARAGTPNYMAFDDHEFWNNFPEAQPHLTRDDDANRLGYTRAAWDCLDLFQSSLNPDPRPELFAPLPDPTLRARSFQFDLAPLSFFFADARTNRDRMRPGARAMIPRDLTALEAWAATLQGPGVLVIGQPMFMSKGDFKDFNPPDFPDEYQRIWRALRTAPYDILVVSGDVHHSRVIECSVGNDPNRRIYEFVSSPASHIPKWFSAISPFHVQDQGTIGIPEVADDTGQHLKAKYFFGTNVANTLGMLRFTPRPGNAVEVGAAFVGFEEKRSPYIAPNQPTTLQPAIPVKFTECTSERLGGPLFTLRKRP